MATSKPTRAALRPIRRTPLYEEVAERLREFIDVEGLEPGDRLLSERELAVRLGVSRTSVRQALTSLRAVGLVEMRHGDGIYLQRSPEDVIPVLTRELLAVHEHLPAAMEVREALEVQTARLAAARRTSKHLAAMRRHVDAMEKAMAAGKDPTAADARFHATIVSAAGNKLLAELMEQLSEPIEETRRASLARFGTSMELLDGHRQILDAIEARDADRAGERMRAHLQDVARFALVERDGRR